MVMTDNEARVLLACHALQGLLARTPMAQEGLAIKAVQYADEVLKELRDKTLAVEAAEREELQEKLRLVDDNFLYQLWKTGEPNYGGYSAHYLYRAVREEAERRQLLQLNDNGKVEFTLPATDYVPGPASVPVSQ